MPEDRRQPDDAGPEGGLPLHAAAESTRDAKVIALLIEAGADVMARTGDRLKDTPLHSAGAVLL